MSLKAARSTLAADLAAVIAAVGPYPVLAYDPPSITGTTVTVSTAGLTGTEYRLYLRVYVPTVQSAEGQDLVDDLVTAIDTSTALRALPRPEWSWRYDSALDVFVMQATVDYPRTDF